MMTGDVFRKHLEHLMNTKHGDTDADRLADKFICQQVIIWDQTKFRKKRSNERERDRGYILYCDLQASPSSIWRKKVKMTNFAVLAVDTLYILWRIEFFVFRLLVISRLFQCGFKFIH